MTDQKDPTAPEAQEPNPPEAEMSLAKAHFLKAFKEKLKNCPPDDPKAKDRLMMAGILQALQVGFEVENHYSTLRLSETDEDFRFLLAVVATDLDLTGWKPIRRWLGDEQAQQCLSNAFTTHPAFPALLFLVRALNEPDHNKRAREIRWAEYFARIITAERADEKPEDSPDPAPAVQPPKRRRTLRDG